MSKFIYLALTLLWVSGVGAQPADLSETRVNCFPLGEPSPAFVARTLENGWGLEVLFDFDGSLEFTSGEVFVLPGFHEDVAEIPLLTEVLQGLPSEMGPTLLDNLQEIIGSNNLYRAWLHYGLEVHPPGNPTEAAYLGVLRLADDRTGEALMQFLVVCVPQSEFSMP